MHPEMRKPFGDRVIRVLNGDCERHAIAVVPGAARFVVGDQLAVFEIPEGTRFFRSAAPTSDADHLVKRPPSSERVIGCMYRYEAAASPYVCLERGFQRIEPPFVRGIVVHYDDLILTEVRLKRSEVAAGGRRGYHFDLEEAGLFQFLFQYRGRGLPCVIETAALTIEKHDLNPPSRIS